MCWHWKWLETSWKCNVLKYSSNNDFENSHCIIILKYSLYHENIHLIMRRYRGSNTCSGQGMFGKLMVQTKIGIVTWNDRIKILSEIFWKTHPTVLHSAAASDVAHLVLKSLFPFGELVRQQPPYAPLQELVDGHLGGVDKVDEVDKVNIHLGGVVRLEARLAQRALPLVVKTSVYARPG